MTHRLYPETCLERWTRLKREKAELEAHAHQARRRTIREEEDRLRLEEQAIRARARRRNEEHDQTRRHHEDEPGQIDVGGFSPISLPMSYDPSPPTAPPDPPSTIDPGGGSSGGGGADGQW